MANEGEDPHDHRDPSADDGDGDVRVGDEEDAAEAAEQAAETPAPGPAKPSSRRAPSPPLLLRWAFYALWMVAAPGLLAIGTVALLAPPPDDLDVGPIRSFVGEQQVPATILAFVFFAMILWRVRHLLPLAAAAEMVGRRDLPPGLRTRFEQAARLNDEARRILRQHQGRRGVPPADRDEVEGALERLEDAMTAERFDKEAFLRAHEDSHEAVQKRLSRWRKSELREYTESIGFAVAVALILRFFVIEAFKIPTGSMIPTLMIGDHIFVAKYAYGPLLPRSDSRLYSRMPPKRGDVIVFKYPENIKQDFIKRVIALPGDTLEVIEGRPIINGLLLPECYVGKLDLTAGARGYLYVEYSAGRAYLTLFNEKQFEGRCDQDLDCPGGEQCREHTCGIPQGPYHVVPGELWVMGDNRDNSADSRAWHSGLGAGVPFGYIKGRAMFVWWSWDPRDGLAADRLGVNVMGTPKLPHGAEQLQPALDRCLANKPPLSATTPPPPR